MIELEVFNFLYILESMKVLLLRNYFLLIDKMIFSDK